MRALPSRTRGCMKTIRFRYSVILCSILVLSFIWEFWIEDLIVQYWSTGSDVESFSERFEYVATVTAFAFISLLYPYFHSRKEEQTRKNYELERSSLIIQLQTAISEIKTLRGMITICSSCKKIREDRDIWIQLEAYLYEHSDATFSHGLCPDCLEAQLSKIEQSLGSSKQ